MSMILVLFLALAGGSEEPSQVANLVLLNGKIATVDERLGTVAAIAVKGDRILAVGDEAAIRSHRDASTRVVDLGGRLVVPGFIDAHGHFTSVGEAMLDLNLRQVKDWPEIVAMVAAAVQQAKPGEWILGRGWHQEKWREPPSPSVKGFPTHAALSAVSPRNPVLLRHASGHACLVNAEAMRLAEIAEATANPDGGEIVKDPAGKPTGVLLETAQGLAQRARAQTTKRDAKDAEQRLRRIIALADRECLAKGVTTFQDAGSTFETIELLRRMAEAREILVRLWVMARTSNEELAAKLAAHKTIGAANHHFTVRAIKVAIDGVLGSRGAWLLNPYSDLAESAGLNIRSIESVQETARLALAHGCQLCVHAIGDRANREVLDIYQRAFSEAGGKTDLRWRIEHAQHLSATDIPRFAKLGVIASMQGIHCTSDAPYVLTRLGPERAEEGAYVWRKLWDTGAVVCNGTDAPVEDVDPIACYHATVTRRCRDGSLFYPEQRLSRFEALESYTIKAAYAAFEEEDKGSLSPGKLADLVVLSHDILTCPEEEIPKTRVLVTMIGGEVVYQAKESQLRLEGPQERK